MTKRLFLPTALVLLFVELVTLKPALAQTTTGSILGEVRDASGAAMPGVTITVINLKTGSSRSVTSDVSGNYVVPQLPVGAYEVTAEMDGFKKAIAPSINLQVDQRARVTLMMEIGDFTQKVEVTTQAPVVKSEASDVGMVVDNKKVNDLPLNGRVYYHLNLLDTGTAQRTGWRTSIWGPVGGANYSFNGSPSDANQYLIDGIISQEVHVTHPTMKVTIDAIQEFKQQASQYGSEFGNGSGAQVNLVTKSGTNDFQGSAFEFMRDSALDARNFFDPPGEKAPFTQNQFGGTIGGPIRRDRAFFFFSYEGTRIRKGVTRTFSVPSVARRNGDFIGARIIYDPTTRTPFPDNIIPADRIDPVAKLTLERLFPLPTRPGEVGNLTASPVQRTDEDQFNIRIDYRFGSKNSVFGRYSTTTPKRVLPLTFSQLPNFADIWDQPAKNAVLNYSRVISSRTFNEVVVGFNRFVQNLLDVDYERDIPRELGINRLDSQFGGNPVINIAGYGRTAGITNSPNNRFDNTYQVVNNFTHIRGQHTLGAGVSFRHNQNNRVGSQANPRGNFVFTARYTALAGVAGTGEALADFLLGFPSQTQGGIGNGFRNTRHNEFGAYFKDDWEVLPDLTLNLGLRYDYFGPWYEKHYRWNFFDFADNRPITTQECMDRGFPRSCYFTEKTNFAPRIGFAYRLFGDNKTVLRGGYGIYYMFGQGYCTACAFNPGSDEASRSLTFVGHPTVPNLTLANGFPLDLASESFSIQVWEDHWKSPYTQQWSLFTQRQVLSNLSIEVGYLGNKGTRLLGSRDFNRPAPGAGSVASRRPYPGFTSINVLSPVGESIYHALRVTGEQRPGGGLSFRTSYTWSKGLNTVGLGSYGESGEPTRRDQHDIRGEFGRSLYDARHRFSLSFTYELPFGNGKYFLPDAKGVLAGLVSGWQLNGIASLQTGTPLDVTLSVDSSNTGAAGSDNRPDRVGDPNEGGARTVVQWFNTAAFVAPRPLAWGNAGKNIVTGPGIGNLDMSLFKTFAVHKNHRLQVRVEAFNILNHPNFDPPNTVFGTAQFGRILSAGDGRDIQLALKYSF